MSTIKANTIQPLSDSASVVVRTNAQDSLTVDSSGNITVRNEAVIDGINIGLGGGSIASNLRFGRNALSGSDDGSLNTALGHQTLNVNITGSSNTAVGYQALLANTTGARNVGVGVLSSGIVNTGSDNTAVGWGSGNRLGSDSQNTCIGSSAAAANGVANSIAIGYNSSAATSNSVYLGNAFATSLYTGNGSVMAPMYPVRAWGRIEPNGASAPVLRSGGNIASVSRAGVGDILVTLSTPMTDAYYAVVASSVGQVVTGVDNRTQVSVVVASPNTFNIILAQSNTDVLRDFAVNNTIWFVVVG